MLDQETAALQEELKDQAAENFATANEDLANHYVKDEKWEANTL